MNAQFTELEKNQLEFLDQAGKRIIELSTGVLGILFVTLAFGKDFPPPYLAKNLPNQIAAAASHRAVPFRYQRRFLGNSPARVPALYQQSDE